MSIEENLKELQSVKQWVAFRFEERNGKRTKIPVNPHTGGNAQTNNPETWGTLEQAQAAAKRYKVDGVGFVFANGYFGIDIDHVIDPEKRTIKPYAKDIIDTVNSYTELSPSGTGVHIIAKGSPNFDRNRNIELGLEMYYPTLNEDGSINRGRYFTVTGNAFGSVKPIEERTAQAQAVYSKYLHKEQQKTTTQPEKVVTPDRPATQSDTDIIDKMLNSENGAKIGRLWGGDTSDYNGDHSSATQALVNYLCYWTNGDAATIDRLFRRSGLYSTMKVENGVKKWDRKHIQGLTYGEATIQRAKNSYTPYTGEQQQTQSEPPAEPELTLEEQQAAYNETTVKAELGDVLYNIINGRSKACYKTNMPQLDAALDGGLYPGLYFFGAVSALGKTSLALQMCDNLAAAGNDVIIFSLEMAMEELVAKSVSRLTYTKLINAGLTTENAKTTRGILTGSRYSRYSEAEKRLINEAFNEYGETTGKHLRIVEGTGDIGVKQIRETVEKHIRLTGKTPILLIDYLQILAPEQLGASDKQNTDRAVFKLKELSREYGIPILGISSFNRNNYSMGVNLGSFKESGAIEYSSDMLIGMQYAGTDQRARGTDRTAAFNLSVWTETMSKLAERGESQPIEFKILKHRNGAKSTVYFLFYPRFNYFECITKEQTLQRIEEILPLEQQVKEEKEKTAKARAKATSTHKDKTDEYNELKASLDAAFKEADPEGKGEAPLKKVAYNMQMTEQKLKRELKQFSLYRHEKGIIYFSQPTDQEPEPSLLEPDF